MIIREAHTEDIDSILELLQASLGEGSSKKTREYFEWKHIHNPFGQSLMLVAEQDEQLIGFRAFMQWQWVKGGRIYRALRAVDTATHPEHQGKGIFKKLTLTLRDKAQLEGFDFIFNTPNAQSKPGYLKMGWRSLGKIPVQIRPVLWSGRARNPNSNKSSLKEALEGYKFSMTQANEKWTTPRDRAYMEWRYRDCPEIRYHALCDPESGDLIMWYPKQKGQKTEIRIVEWLPGAGQAKGRKLKNLFQSFTRDTSPNFISVAPGLSLGLFNSGFLPALSLGPELTWYPLGKDLPDAPELKAFAYSLGDMELF